MIPERPRRAAGGHPDPRRTGRSSTSSTSSRENRTYDQVLGDDPRGDGDPHLTLFGKRDHAEPARARPALPAARPRLRELRGLDRRPLLDRRRRGLRLRDQELAPELRRPRSALRLRRLRGQRAAEGLHLPADARNRASPSTTTARRSRGISPFPDKDRTPEQTAQNAQVLSATHTDVQVVGGCYDSDISIFDTPAIGPR